MIANEPILNLATPIAIGLGAVPGALTRFYITLFCNYWFGFRFPYGTLIINLSGAFAMGFVSALMTTGFLSSTALQRMIAVGFMGAYTTFSTYALDTANLRRAGYHNRAVVYWASSALLGGLSLESGIFLGMRFQ